MKNTHLFTLVFLNTLPFARNLSAQDAQRPNVILIYADDLGRGMLSYYGQKYISTPNIDRLFHEGTCFSQAYGCMYSAPARASLLTGYHDCRTDKWNISKGGQFKPTNTIDKVEVVEEKLNAERVRLPKGDLTLPLVFKQAGYVTGEVGKIDWGFAATRQQVRENGWDYYYGYLDHQRCHGYYPPFLFENDSIVHIEGNTLETCGKAYEKESPENYINRWDMTGKKVYSQHLFLDKMLQFIREHKDTPFFLYHPTQLPHGPVSVPEVHPEVKNNPELSEIEKEYASMVKMLDDHVGVLLKELEQLGLLENTIFIFTVDNGHETYYTNGNRVMKSPVRDMDGRPFDAWDYPYTSERTGDRFDGNNGFTGKKWMNWEGGIRIPLVFSWPGKIKAGKTSDQVVTNYDLLPTFADMLGVELPYAKDGESILPVLTGGEEILPSFRYIYLNSNEGPAIIDSDGWKLRYNRKLNRYRLHYIPGDYREERILNEEYPQIVNRLKQQLKKEIPTYE